MKTARILGSFTAAVLLAGTVQFVSAQRVAPTCPFGNQPGWGQRLNAQERAEFRAGLQTRRGQPRMIQGRGRGFGAGYGRGAGLGRGPGGGFCRGTGPCLALGTDFGTIDEATTTNLRFIQEEEKMARDVYTVLAEKWDLPVFANIARAEQRHTDAVSRLLAAYQVEDTLADEPGVFANPAVQAVYDKSVAAGVKSLPEALAAAVAIEEMDIESLEAMLKAELDPPVERVLTNLLAASRRHLEVFNALLSADAPPVRPNGRGAGRPGWGR